MYAVPPRIVRRIPSLWFSVSLAVLLLLTGCAAQPSAPTQPAPRPVVTPVVSPAPFTVVKAPELSKCCVTTPAPEQPKASITTKGPELPKCCSTPAPEPKKPQSVITTKPPETPQCCSTPVDQGQLKNDVTKAETAKPAEKKPADESKKPIEPKPKGSNNPKTAELAKKGQEMHDDEDWGEGTRKEVKIGNRRADSVNESTKTIGELKPNNEKAMKRGTQQLKEEILTKEKETKGEEWSGELRTYNPDKSKGPTYQVDRDGNRALISPE